MQDHKQPSLASAIEKRTLDLMINVPSEVDNKDAFIIRRLAVDNHIPLLTNAETGRLLLKCLADKDMQNPDPLPWRSYVKAM